MYMYIECLYGVIRKRKKKEKKETTAPKAAKLPKTPF